MAEKTNMSPNSQASLLRFAVNLLYKFHTSSEHLVLLLTYLVLWESLNSVNAQPRRECDEKTCKVQREKPEGTKNRIMEFQS